MGYFQDEYQTEDQQSRFLKADDFTAEGIELGFIGMQKVKANDPQYGANEADWFYKTVKKDGSRLLDKGETFEYSFMADEGEKIYTSKSAGFFIAMRSADPKLGDKLLIKKTGEKRDTRYSVEIIAKVN